LGGAGGWSSGGTRPTQGTFASGGGQGNPTAGANGGSGGGAGIYSLPTLTGAGNIAANITNFAQGVFVAQGTFGYNLNALNIPGNGGLNGYGSGGGAASTTTQTVLTIPGGINAGIGAMDSTAAIAATANYGGGGGGGTVSAASVNRLASAGGSGVCIIRYWS
jgi:hypothetical protein